MIAFEARPRLGLVVAHPGLRLDLIRALEAMGCGVEAYEDLAAARCACESRPPQGLLVDLDVVGAAQWLAETVASDPPRLVMTDEPGRAHALGAAACLAKPFSIHALEAGLVELLEQTSTRGTAAPAREAILRTEDPVFRDRLARARRWARSSAAINLEGEFGTGRRALARAIHAWSPRREHPFVLLEPASFASGGTTGAPATVRDAVERAREGTLVLVDPIGLPAPGRQALALALREEPAPGAPRCLTLTNAPLAEAAALGRLEIELQYRLEGLRLRLPPLREREADHEALCRSTLRRVARELGRGTPPLSSALLESLRAEGFPGNGVGLESRLRQAMVRGDLEAVEADAEERPRAGLGLRPAADASLDLKTLERDTIVRALARWDGNRTRASASLGISVRTLRNKIRHYGLR